MLWLGLAEFDIPEDYITMKFNGKLACEMELFALADRYGQWLSILFVLEIIPCKTQLWEDDEIDVVIFGVVFE